MNISSLQSSLHPKHHHGTTERNPLPNRLIFKLRSQKTQQDLLQSTVENAKRFFARFKPTKAKSESSSLFAHQAQAERNRMTGASKKQY